MEKEDLFMQLEKEETRLEFLEHGGKKEKSKNARQRIKAIHKQISHRMKKLNNY